MRYRVNAALGTALGTGPGQGVAVSHLYSRYPALERDLKKKKKRGTGRTKFATPLPAGRLPTSAGALLKPYGEFHCKLQ